MEYVITGIVLAGFAYFIYTRVSKKRKNVSNGGGGGGGPSEPGNTVQH